MSPSSEQPTAPALTQYSAKRARASDAEARATVATASDLMSATRTCIMLDTSCGLLRSEASHSGGRSSSGVGSIPASMSMVDTKSTSSWLWLENSGTHILSIEGLRRECLSVSVVGISCSRRWAGVWARKEHERVSVPGDPGRAMPVCAINLGLQPQPVRE